ncbi:MAG: twin-arginine translocase TatA/TatE family subunit [bacterium]|nr:twin-arginine translocase TatA/TatE family subunit [bacterium]
MRPGTWQIILLIVVILVVFGSTRLPMVAESIGKSLKIFKREVKELREDDAPAAGSSAATPPAASTNQPGAAPGELQAAPGELRATREPELGEPTTAPQPDPDQNRSL